MPELHSLYPGDELNLKAYPHLKQIIQLGHTTIRGVIKFKDSMVYANPKISNYGDGVWGRSAGCNNNFMT
jgi:hypothetical protein